MNPYREDRTAVTHHRRFTPTAWSLSRSRPRFGLQVPAEALAPGVSVEAGRAAACLQNTTEQAAANRFVSFRQLCLI